jgi:hypothetical protein
MYAYCGNNPVNRADPSGKLFFIFLGAVTGFLGSAVTSLLLGNDVDTAINDGFAGAIGGAIAGAGVDAGLMLVATGGAATPIIAAGIAYVAGGLGNVVTTGITSRGTARGDEYLGSFIIGGTFNLFSLGTAWDCAGKTIKEIAIKGALKAEENLLTGSATAVTTSVATHIGLSSLGRNGMNTPNTVRRQVK